MSSKIAEINSPNIVIDDLRFENEVRFVIDDLDGKVIKISRDDIKFKINPKYKSEKIAVDSNLISYQVYNNTTISDLKRQVDVCIG